MGNFNRMKMDNVFDLYKLHNTIFIRLNTALGWKQNYQ